MSDKKNLDKNGILQAKQCKNHVKLILNDSIRSDGHTFSKLTPDEFFTSQLGDVVENKPYYFTNYFKARFYELSCSYQIDPRSLSQYLKSKNSGERHALKDEFGGKELSSSRGFASQLKNEYIKPYEIYHHHIDAYHQSVIANLNNYLRRENIKLENVPTIIDSAIKDQQLYRTGNWVLYKEHSGIRYYLDVVEHSDDSYIKDIGLPNYLTEVSHIFPKGVITNEREV
jgi:hypothetical protein